jgi:iron complex outermembrane recepter protein
VKKTNNHILKYGIAPLAIAIMLCNSSAWAQAEQQEPPVAEEVEEDAIVVTGSRISRPELEVANPIVAVTAAAIESSGKTNITDILIRNPALTSSTGGSLSGGADALFGETGGNYLNLRNLGEDRTLVLVNGKRHISGIPNSAAVDINSIPQDLIEKVDVLTGGASAIYGADGVSGVVNFVLKRDFQGLSARGQTGISSRGDAATQYGSVVAGTNFAGDRGNIAIAYEYNKQDRLTAFDRDFSGNPLRTFNLLRNQADFPDDPNVPDNIYYNNVSWADSAPDGAIDLDLDGIPDFTGSGLPYDRGIVLRSAGGRAIGGSNTPTAGYFGDLLPSSKSHAANILARYEFAPAFKVYAEGKYVQTKAFSVGQPSFDFFTFLAPDNAYLNDRFGAGAAPGGALISRDNFDLGQRGETVKRETKRFVIGAEGEISDHAKYDISYVYGSTSASNTQTSNLIRDRYFAALDAVRDGQGNIVCRSTITPGNIDPNNFDSPATTFTTGAGSICRPLNFLGSGVASQDALDFVLSDNTNRSKVTQQVASGYITGDFGALFELPGGPIDFAIGGEYRRETSSDTPDLQIQNGEFRDFSAVAPSSGKFNVKEAFAELSVPLLKDVPFAHVLSASAAIRLSDYSTIGKTTTWKVDGVYAPIRDIRFRGSYSQSVRAPNIGEIFAPQSQVFDFVTDPCDVNERANGKPTRTANCVALLSGLGLSAAQIAAFSPSTDAQATTSRLGLDGGNLDIQEETAKTWTVGVVIQPSFLRGLTMTFDWYNIKISDAINTPSATELAALCVDQADINNRFCSNIFRDPTTGFVLGDSDDPQRRIGFIVGPENVANFKTDGADFTINYAVEPEGNIGKFNFNLTGGYLNRISTVPSIGADPTDEYLQTYNPKWRGSFALDWKLDDFTFNYDVSYFSKTLRFTNDRIAGNPDSAAPENLYFKKRIEIGARVAYDISDRFRIYGGVNNLTDEKPDFGQLSYPVSGVGRFFYVGAKVKLDKIM